MQTYQLMPPMPFDVRLMNMISALMGVGLLILALGAGFWWVIRNQDFALGRIVVEGQLFHNTAQTLRNSIAGKITGNIFTADLQRARAAFEGAPWVQRAAIRREFPQTLRVYVEEHHPVAFWGDENAMTLLNTEGKVFAVQAMDLDANELPRLDGPAGSEKDLWWMYQQLEPMFGALSLGLGYLEEGTQGGWKAGLRGGAEVEMGTGDLPQLVERVDQFIKTLGYVAAQYKRSPADLEFADLRHSNGYALRLQGVTTTDALPVKRSSGKSR